MSRLLRRLAGPLIAAVAATAAILAPAMPAHAESNGGVRIMPLGDSITDGSADLRTSTPARSA
jgi:hypothetical protein